MEGARSAASVEPVVRGLTSAAKALRLYPPTSPIPRQSVEAAVAALADFLTSEPVLTLRVARDGLAWAGETIAPGAPGAGDLADALRDHGVAEVAFTPGTSADDLLAFLGPVLEKPEDIRARGGLAAIMASAGVDAVRVSDVTLTVVETDALMPEDADADEFLRELAGDPSKLAMWINAVAKGDPQTMAAGLADLARAAGGGDKLAMTLAACFDRVEREGRDTLFGLALDESPLRAMFAGMMERLPTGTIAETLASGNLGVNMLSMSSALTRLPLAQRMSDVLKQIEEILPAMGRAAKEIGFLEHMVEVRGLPEPEQALADEKPFYRKVAEIAKVDGAQIDAAREGVKESATHTDERAAATMLQLLDQQKDFALYCRTLEGLAGMVPSFVEREELNLAARIVDELASRESRAVQPWPELTGRLRSAIDAAVSNRTTRALLRAVAQDETAVPQARGIMSRAGDQATAAFVEEALALKPNGLAVAEKVVGRRIVDMLAAAAPRAQWFQVGQLVARLATESDQRSQQAIEGVLRRADEQSRREAASGLAAVGGPGVVHHLGSLLADPSAEVAIVAARALGRQTAPGTAAALSARLDAIDTDGKDFLLAREIIGALAHTGDGGADAVLTKLAGRRSLMKRGHFAEIQELVRQADAERRKGRDAR